MNGDDLVYVLTSRELIAALAMQGLLSAPREPGDCATVADVAVKYADALMERLSSDPVAEGLNLLPRYSIGCLVIADAKVAEGLNLLPMYSRELDEGLTDDQGKGAGQ